MKRGVAKPLTPFADAVRIWRGAIEAAGCPDRLPAQTVGIDAAVGRVPAQVIRTLHPCPTYRAAAMDGYAVRSRELDGAGPEQPKRLALGEAALPLDTGAAVPAGFDAVVAKERARAARGSIEVRAQVAPGTNVRLPGDDVPPGVAIGWPGIALRPLDCATLVASGCTNVDVVKRPRLAILPTGDEIVPPGTKPAPGTVIESNASMIAGEARALGADVTVWPIIGDDDAAMERALREAIGAADVVAVIAGSSAGRRDRGGEAIARVGTIDVRGVATRPARPVILGHAGAVPLVDLPGYPVSCHLAFEAYVAPLLRRLAGFADPLPRRARLSESIEADGSLDEWRAGSLLMAPGSPRAVVVPLADVGGGLYRLAQADARFHLKRGTAHFGRFAAVPWTPLRDADAAARPLLCAPYDPLLEEMAALGGFRCRWTDDESGAALDAGLADAAGVVVRDGDLSILARRTGAGRKMLPLGLRREGVCHAHPHPTGANSHAPEGADAGTDPWEGAAAVAAGTRPSARCTKYVADRYELRFDEGEPALYAILWDDRPGHRFPWGIVLGAALSALADAAPALGWRSLGMPQEVRSR